MAIKTADQCTLVDLTDGCSVVLTWVFSHHLSG